METLSSLSLRNDGLTQMFDLQEALIVHYRRIEGLPEYPLNLNDRSSQKLLKEFVRRTIEELSEAYEQLGLLLLALSNNADDAQKAEYHQGYNLEIADVLHFTIETLLYCGLDKATVYTSIRNYAEDNHLPRKDTLMESMYVVAQLLNMKDKLSCLNVYTHKDYVVGVGEFASNGDDSIYAGARRLGPDTYDKHAEFMWAITHTLNRATNQLKNREHNQADRITNETLFRDAILEAFLLLFRYLEFSGQTMSSIANLYKVKNDMNLKRIHDGY